jgi:hypothetical protein
MRLILVASIGLAIIFAYLLLTSISVRKTTGLVTVHTFAADSSVIISQNQSTATLVGTGGAKLRLQPGTYLVSAKSAGRTGNARITVRAKTASTVNITAGSVVDKVPSSDSITFIGTDEFIDRGLSVEQVGNLKNLFFAYNKNTNKVVIDSNSLDRGDHDPDSDDPFTINFTGSIDGKAYKATITYSDTENLELTLFNPQTGDQLFDKSSVQSAANN